MLWVSSRQLRAQRLAAPIPQVTIRFSFARKRSCALSEQSRWSTQISRRPFCGIDSNSNSSNDNNATPTTTTTTTKSTTAQTAKAAQRFKLDRKTIKRTLCRFAQIFGLAKCAKVEQVASDLIQTHVGTNAECCTSTNVFSMAPDSSSGWFHTESFAWDEGQQTLTRHWPRATSRSDDASSHPVVSSDGFIELGTVDGPVLTERSIHSALVVGTMNSNSVIALLRRCSWTAKVPQLANARFHCRIYGADAAKYNKKGVAHWMQRCRSRNQLDFVVWCQGHALHRCRVPLMLSFNIAPILYCFVNLTHVSTIKDGTCLISLFSSSFLWLFLFC